MKNIKPCVETLFKNDCFHFKCSNGYVIWEKAGIPDQPCWASRSDLRREWWRWAESCCAASASSPTRSTPTPTTRCSHDPSWSSVRPAWKIKWTFPFREEALLAGNLCNKMLWQFWEMFLCSHTKIREWQMPTNTTKHTQGVKSDYIYFELMVPIGWLAFGTLELG